MNANQKIALAKRRYPVGSVVQSAYTNRTFVVTSGTTFSQPPNKHGLMMHVPTPGASGDMMHYKVYFTPHCLRYCRDKTSLFNGWAKCSSGHEIESSIVINTLHRFNLERHNTKQEALLNVSVWTEKELNHFKNISNRSSFAANCDTAKPGEDFAEMMIIADELDGMTKEMIHDLKERLGDKAPLWIKAYNRLESQSEIDRREWAEFFKANPPSMAIVKNEDGRFDLYPKPNQDLREAMAEAAADQLPGLTDQEDKPRAIWNDDYKSLNDDSSLIGLRNEHYPPFTFKSFLFCVATAIVVAHIIIGLFMAAKYISEWQ